MLSNPYESWEQGRRRDAVLEVPRSLWGAPFKLFSGGFDLLAKTSEGIKNSVSLQTYRVSRQRPPLAIHTDRVVRQFVPHESAAYGLVSLCKPDALHSEGRRAEAYVYHHVIDYRPPNPAAPLRTMVLVVTSRRVVFGSVDPPRVHFEVPKDRMARVELYPPFTKILLWTWSELSWLRVGSALPNVIMERHVVGSNPLQLRAAFEHLRILAHQQDRDVHGAGGIGAEAGAGADPSLPPPPSPPPAAARRRPARQAQRKHTF